jgi:uncharacterized protein YndB with AHSA1/START domain
MVMLTTVGSASIACSPADAFAFIADLRNDPRWHTDVLEARLVDGDTIGKDVTFEIKTKPVMGISGGTVTISEYEPPSRVVFSTRMGKLQPVTTFTVVPEGAGCRVTRRIEMEPPGLLRALTPLMGGMLRKSNTGFLENLKGVLEDGR